MHPSQDERSKLEAELRDGLDRHYTRYYREALGLPDWEQRVAARRDEVAGYGRQLVERVVGWLDYDFRGRDALVVGAGTGAEAFALEARGARVSGIDADPEAVRLLRLRARLAGVEPKRFAEAAAERLPHADASFDFVWCHSVLEHVRDAERSVDEMIRVCRGGGWIYIGTPDARFPWEGHYKLGLLPFAPRWLNRLGLRLRGRDPTFFSQTRPLSARQLDRLLWRRPVTTWRVRDSLLHPTPVAARDLRFAFWLGILRNQTVFLERQGAGG
jgi:SAM-dependent methyltransferase